ncbi:coiled-coil domain-containing protein 124 isoform X1 [Patagioenas fasciata]|uniref:coiled-coil domain-containing protein 124 isoform X1 n=1 Tax=Patagioenas fasciata TaxID=372321 RepID=UPI003A997E5E
MPKKFQGENTKSAAARARKAEAKAAADAKRQQELEDAYWKDEDKHVMRKEQRKHFGRALNATPALLWEQPSSANRAWRSSGGSVMHKGAAEPMSPARHVRVPPLALRHESPRVTFPGELWLEGTKSPSVLGSSGFYPGDCFLCHVRVFSSFPSPPTPGWAAARSTALSSLIAVWVSPCDQLKRFWWWNNRVCIPGEAAGRRARATNHQMCWKIPERKDRWSICQGQGSRSQRLFVLVCKGSGEKSELNAG